jgi:hypothetical protein
MSKKKNESITKSLDHSFRRNGPKQPEKRYEKIVKKRTNLQERAGNGYTANLWNSELTEPCGTLKT